MRSDPDGGPPMSIHGFRVLGVHAHQRSRCWAVAVLQIMTMDYGYGAGNCWGMILRL